MKAGHSVKFVLRGLLLGAFVVAIAAASAEAEEVTVTGRLQINGPATPAQSSAPLYAVVWLTPLGEVSDRRVPSNVETAPRRYRLVQKNKRFDPHMLVVPVGSVVDFPNRDPVFHNVFSLFEGKRFDLGLYESGATRAVAFNRAGICYIFCNIHPEMSAVVVVLSTPYYAVPDKSGSISIPGVPPGRYRLQVWSERSAPESLLRLAREITVTPDAAWLGVIQLEETTGLPLAHKNKYGREYDPAVPPGALYRQP